MIFRALLLCSLAFRILFFFLFFDEKTWNIHMSFRFDERALAILSGQATENLAAWGSYPLFLAGFYKVLDVVGLLSHRLTCIFWVHQILGLLTAWLCLRFLTVAGVSKRLALILVSVFFLFNPLQVLINGMSISESLFQLVAVSAGILAFSRSIASPWLRWIPFFAAVAMGVIIRNIFIPFAALSVLALPFVSPDRLKTLRQPAFWSGILLAIAMILGAGQINALFDRDQRSTLSLNRGANIAQTWCEAPTLHFKTEVTSFWFSPPAFWPLSKTRSLFLETDFGDSPYYSELALQCLREDPSLLLLRTRSLLNVFDGPFYPDPLKRKLEPAYQIWGFLSLVLFIFCAIGFIFLWRNQAVLWWSFFVVSQLAAVYLANAGEARFLYSFLPGLVILGGLSGTKLNGKLRWGTFGISLLAAGALWSIPPLHELMNRRDTHRFLELDASAKRARVDQALNALPAASDLSFCDQNFPQATACWSRDAGSCPEARLRQELAESLKKPQTEEQLFCRNLWLSRLQNREGFQFQANEIQSLSPLPGGPFHPGNPIVAVAGQLLQAELLKKSGREDLIPPGESPDELLASLMRYQHRIERNRAEYRGAVVENLRKADTSEKAMQIYRETLKNWLNFRLAE